MILQRAIILAPTISNGHITKSSTKSDLRQKQMLIAPLDAHTNSESGTCLIQG
jgi:hypothetical protein